MRAHARQPPSRPADTLANMRERTPCSLSVTCLGMVLTPAWGIVLAWKVVAVLVMVESALQG
jgi:hypothetical protein